MKQKLGPMQKKWVDALKSGKYKQTTKRLTLQRNNELKHCCLGVVCDINKNLLSIAKFRVNVNCYGISYDADIMEVPNELKEKLKLFGRDGCFAVENLEESEQKELLQYIQTIYCKNRRFESLIDFRDKKEVDSLIDLNDKCKFTFKQIAYVVEKWPQIIFKKAV